MKLLLICMSFLLPLMTAWNRVTALHWICSQPATYGPCDGYHSMWAYSQTQKKCFQFDYSGCGGNFNRFSEESDCLIACSETKPSMDYDNSDIID